MGLWRVTLYQAFRAKWGKEKKRERIEGVDIVTYQNQGFRVRILLPTIG